LVASTDKNVGYFVWMFTQNFFRKQCAKVQFAIVAVHHPFVEAACTEKSYFTPKWTTGLPNGIGDYEAFNVIFSL
jgi:hypothetical protein